MIHILFVFDILSTYCLFCPLVQLASIRAKENTHVVTATRFESMSAVTEESNADDIGKDAVETVSDAIENTSEMC